MGSLRPAFFSKGVIPLLALVGELFLITLENLRAAGIHRCGALPVIIMHLKAMPTVCMARSTTPFCPCRYGLLDSCVIPDSVQCSSQAGVK